jgi:uncharacterized Zn finger protein
MSWYNYGWRPYVPVAVRRQRAKKKMESLRKKGVNIQPVEIQGRKIATTFWGQAWCDHLESFSDYENRLPRGRTYVRNGSVCHLAITRGTIEAKVSGSELYSLRIAIKTLPPAKWKAVKQRCSGQIGSLIELLQGRLSDHVMGVVTDRSEGLFPLPGEISFDCSCPDWAVMCKHVAAVLYGVGARLDQKPELLFLLRGVNHDELIEADAEAAVSRATSSAKRGRSKRLAAGELSDVFGIDLDPGGAEEPSPRRSRTKAAKKKTPKKATKKTSAAKKTAKRSVRKKPAKAAAKKRAARKPGKKA